MTDSVKNLRLKMILAGAAVALIVGSAGQARAGGWFADTFIRPISPDLADQADDANRQLGHPFEHGIAAISNYIIPGSGVVLEGAWTAQDIRNAWENGELSDQDAATALAEVGESLY